MSRIYRYVPVSSPRHTRVLRLEPSPDAASPLRCSLSEVSLDALEDPSTGYTALSYTWDAQSPSQIVECDGGTLHVTANCEAAMRRLRRPDETHALWIDSIRIDQSAAAIDERSAQVAVMGEVYMRAKQVVVWLGESDEKFEVFLRRLAEIFESLRMPSSPGRFTNITELRDILLGVLREKVRAIAREAPTASDDPFAAVFERSWFHRMWTIQEVTLSLPERIVVRCGEHTFPWQPFLGIVTVLRDAEYPWRGWKRAMGLRQALWSYLKLKRHPGARELVRDGPLFEQDPHMFSILQGVRNKCSGDPMDNVFALYGLFQELGIPMPTPDYRKSVGQVYKEATAACINYDRSLRILYHASSDLRREDLSSWVPDYSSPGWEDSDMRYGLIGIHVAAGGSSREALRRTLVINHLEVLADEAAPGNFRHWYDVLTDERLDSESLVRTLMGGPGMRFHRIAMAFPL
ncbi:hypothetical protein MAPG_10525 [Magnaporthiopsis poae ATCC 64411]|uniref:Heterokaryon incompatibility domain-containing protein n=1 Tax=Magnaporthiopsis poae (strain ATCC 64411 / 73-15) TaxID=644358 RepID=A0A0C4ECU0_MAGP6|nr:hypothetical protein MAPG_10525 [Magnaporthiopsis poae ATCC 64411]